MADGLTVLKRASCLQIVDAGGQKSAPLVVVDLAGAGRVHVGWLLVDQGGQAIEHQTLDVRVEPERGSPEELHPGWEDKSPRTAYKQTMWFLPMLETMREDTLQPSRSAWWRGGTQAY